MVNLTDLTSDLRKKIRPKKLLLYPPRPMNECPYCGSTVYQRRDGHSPTGIQRFRCGPCGRTYAPQTRETEAEVLAREALQLFKDGMSLEYIAQYLAIPHETAVDWFNNNIT